MTAHPVISIRPGRPSKKGWGGAVATAAISLRRLVQGWAFCAPMGPSFLEHDDDALLLLTMLLSDAFERHSPHPVLHAGAFAADGGAVIYLAPMAEGKSSHSFAAWRRGYTVLGDDRIALRIAEGAAQAIPKCLKLRIEKSHVPSPWREQVPASESLIGGYDNDRRWVLSPCSSPITPAAASRP